MINLILNTLQKSKAIDIVLIDKKDNFIYTNYIIIVSGTSITHIKSIAKNLFFFIKKNVKSHVNNISGRNTDWILIDLDNIVIHIMSKESRKNYDLESLNI